MKKKIQQLREKRLAKKEQAETGVVPRITNENVAEHREEVLSGARKYIYPESWMIIYVLFWKQ